MPALTSLLRAIPALCAVLALLSMPSVSVAQQFVTDDASVVDAGGCQVEAWYARSGSWVLPACHVVPHLEITAGVGTVRVAPGEREVRYVLQGKTLFLLLEPDRFGIGLVAGFGLDPLGQVVARRIDAMYAYVPLSVPLAGERAVIHQNVGWAYAVEPVDDAGAGGPAAVRRHTLTWGMRADVALAPRMAAVGELFGQSRVFPEYQVGLRVILVPERVLTDVSYTAATTGDAAGVFTVGIAWTPPRFRRPGGTAP